MNRRVRYFSSCLRHCVTTSDLILKRNRHVANDREAPLVWLYIGGICLDEWRIMVSVLGWLLLTISLDPGKFCLFSSSIEQISRFKITLLSHQRN